MTENKTLSPSSLMRPGNVLAAQCPSRQILQRLSSRWGLLVLLVLKSGTKRFSEIRSAIEGISERMLTQTLQQLEADNMLTRKSYDTVPPHVEYTLTHFGEEAASRVANLVEWLEATLPEILASK
nr:helix-turn-helix domain-containing protein [Pelistega europaea]